MKLRRGIALLRGSPNTLVVGKYVIDPGQPEERAQEITAVAGGSPVVLFTHFHADHLAAVLQGTEVCALGRRAFHSQHHGASIFHPWGLYRRRGV